MPTLSHIEDLEFDLATKLLEELVNMFDNMPSAKLNESNIDDVEDAQGVYQLFNNNELVYIGKADSKLGLKARLLRHAKKITCRKNINTQNITFKAIRVYVFTAMDLEQLLINHYKNRNLSPDWQHSGFGSNDPGKERDTTSVKADSFDALYPIDIDINVTIESENNQVTAAYILKKLKSKLNYNIRFETIAPQRRAPHQDLEQTNIILSQKTQSVKNFLKLIDNNLDSTWKITILPGYIIIYKNDKRKIPSGKDIGSL
ncbi:GIY-YIG nuclease family protein [Cobetia sp. UCD-24C]|uniref:GIY-YIG nuclease family protein n=1 Tax=Cobetia sp. UCD-24C TaxID=1716176 RepID=UPI0013649CF6|nr:GIY-YIG nuclease family protein [Cobetia sp. UCD-24C]